MEQDTDESNHNQFREPCP